MARVGKVLFDTDLKANADQRINSLWQRTATTDMIRTCMMKSGIST